MWTWALKHTIAAAHVFFMSLELKKLLYVLFLEACSSCNRGGGKSMKYCSHIWLHNNKELLEASPSSHTHTHTHARTHTRTLTSPLFQYHALIFSFSISSLPLCLPYSLSLLQPAISARPACDVRQREPPLCSAGWARGGRGVVTSV